MDVPGDDSQKRIFITVIIKMMSPLELHSLQVCSEAFTLFCKNVQCGGYFRLDQHKEIDKQILEYNGDKI